MTNLAPDLLGQSQPFLGMLEHASRTAMIERPVLVCGPKGAGKTLLAARMHFLSPRWDGPFIDINCAAYSTEDLGRLLFGAGGERSQGLLRDADGGTLLLDNVAAAALTIQERLLPLLDSAEAPAPGDNDRRRIDIRVIATASDDLRQHVHDGAMSASFYHALCFDVVSVPSLNDRSEDIDLLAAHFATHASAELGLKFPGFAPEALVALHSHDWPGNIRELRNTVERAAFHWGEGAAKGSISKISLNPMEPAFGAFKAASPAHKKTSLSPPYNINAQTPEGAYDLRAYMNALEKKIVEDALTKNGDSQKKAAEALSLSYDQIRGIIKKHGITT